MRAAPPADEAVRREIVAAGRTNLLVEAGAGTGKTRLMVEHIVRLIETGEATLASIVATTFTERAAAELKERLRAELLARLTVAPVEIRERLREALIVLDAAAVSTIHAFAARLLRERPVEAGIDPGFEVMETDAAQRMAREAWEEWREGELARDPDRWRRLLAIFAVENDRDAMWEVAEAALEYRDLLPTSDAAPTYPDVAAFIADFSARARAAAGFAEAHCRERDADRLWQDGFAGLVSAIEGLRALPLHEAAAALAGLELKTGRLGNQSNWTDKDALARARAERADLGRLAAGFAEEFHAAAAADLLALVGSFARHLEREKRRRGTLDFTDLLLLARNLLRDSPAARTHFRDQFRRILVDEFQDTDPLQCEILLLLAGTGEGREPWQGPLLPGRLLVVGDPKQSIYRFRRADIAIYERFKNRLAGEPGALARWIQVNFRCTPGIVRWVNQVFAARMRPEGEGAVQAEYVPLVAHRGDTPRGPAVSYLPGGAHVEEDVSVEEFRRVEAHLVAAAIRRIVAEERWEVAERDGVAVPAGYRHIAVLYPQRTHLALLEDALFHAGIPFVSDGGKDFYLDADVHYLVQTLLAIENPEDRIAVAAALVGPVFAFSDEDLFLYAAAAGHLDYLRPEPSALDHVPGLESAMRLLADLHANRNREPCFRTIARLLDETRARAFAALGPRGPRVVGALELLRDRARLLQEREGLTFGETVLRLEEERQTQADVAQREQPDREGDQVQLMTIHRAKGLEFPIVFLAGLSSDFTRGGSPRTVRLVPLRAEGRIEFQTKSAQGIAVRTAGFADAAAAEKMKDLAERVRQLYVAATRARDHLIVSCVSPGHRPEAARTYLDLIPELGDLSGTSRPDGVFVFPVNRFPVPSDDDRTPYLVPSDPEIPGDTSLAAPVAEFGESLRARVRAASARLRAERPSRHDEAFPSRAVGPDAEIAGPAVGAAFHALMERVDFAAPGDLETLARAVARRHGVPDAATALAAWARRALGSELGERIRRASVADRLCEVPYGLVDGDGRIVEGTIDLAFREEGEWIIVDYKTDRAREDDLPALAAHHRPQLLAYAEAVRRVTGREPAEVHLLFVRLGRSVRL